MSLSFVSAFQDKLYEILKRDQLFAGFNIGVYFSVQQDAKYPFILINILKSTNLSNPAVERYQLDFEVCIFVRAKGGDMLLKIANVVNKLLKIDYLCSDQYDLIAINSNVAEWVRGQDLLTTKLVINYKALLRVS